MFSKRLAAVAVALVLPLAGCGGDDDAGAGGAGLAKMVPERAPVYAEVVVRPDGELKTDVEAAAKKLLGTDDAGREVIALVDRFLAESDTGDKDSYAEDLEPWLGDHIAGTVVGLTATEDPDFAILLASKDDDVARERLAEGAQPREKKDYKGVAYELDDGTAGGVVDGAVVIGTEKAFQQVVDVVEGGGRSLADAENFKKARDAVEDEGLGFAYLEPAGVFDALAASFASGFKGSGIDPAQLTKGIREQAPAAVGVAIDIADDAVGLDIATLARPGGGAAGAGFTGEGAAEALADLPAGSSAAFGLGEVGAALREVIKQFRTLGDLGNGISIDTAIGALQQQTGLRLEEDLLSWMGRGGVFVRAGSLTDLGGALVVETKDPAKTKAAMAKVSGLLRQAGAPVRPASGPGIDEGFTIATGQAAFPVTVAVGGKRFVIAVGASAVEQALGSGDRLGESAAFKRAGEQLGDEVDPIFFLDVASVSGLLGLLGNDPDLVKVREVAGRLSSVVAGTRRDGELGRTKLTVGLK